MLKHLLKLITFAQVNIPVNFYYTNNLNCFLLRLFYLFIILFTFVVVTPEPFFLSQLNIQLTIYFPSMLRKRFKSTSHFLAFPLPSFAACYTFWLKKKTISYGREKQIDIPPLLKLDLFKNCVLIAKNSFKKNLQNRKKLKLPSMKLFIKVFLAEVLFSRKLANVCHEKAGCAFLPVYNNHCQIILQKLLISYQSVQQKKAKSVIRWKINSMKCEM